MAKRIFIMDDDADLTTVLAMTLEHAGYEVDVSFSGTEALDKIGKTAHDLFVFDYYTPTMKGDVLCEMVRATKNVPIIIITGFTDKTESFFKSKGATEVIYKPFRREVLRDKVKELLGE